MKNILLITSLYPSDDVKFLNNTAVCHYFAKEWVSMGYNVRVVHSYRIYPNYYYPFLKLFGKYLAKTQATAILDKRLDFIHSFVLEGVKVDRIPIRKSRPHGEFAPKDIVAHCNVIATILAKDNFIPDVIAGHFITPCLDIVTELKSYYVNAKTAVSMHGKGLIRGYSTDDDRKFTMLDFMGYRSHSIRKVYESMYGKRPYLMCPSGVPESYIVDTPRTFENGVKDFIYVGSFMDRKHPSTVVEAIANSMSGKDYTIKFVGDGAGKEKIIKTAKACGNLDKIRFTGRIPREEVTKEMDKADVFIMVSENETFGLVYLEAMARGCIAVASINEGMDGFIANGKNGFLCNAGDTNALAEVISLINKLSAGELSALSRASIATARAMTDKKVAEDYIKVFEDKK